MNGLALCSGIGGIELGLRLAIGESYRTVGYCEREAYAAATLVARMANETLDCAPIWDDITTFPCEPYRGKVDIITAGFPCQPISVAGRREGTADERWLWPHVARVIREVGPSLVFLENVPGILMGEQPIRDVVGDLAELGFDTKWDLFSAGSSGAWHKRARWFLVADRGQLATHRAQSFAESRSCTAADIGGDGEVAAVASDANSSRREATRWRPTLNAAQEPHSRSWWSREPGVGRVVYGLPAGMDRRRALGNAVVPAVAARAFVTLMRRFKDGH